MVLNENEQLKDSNSTWIGKIPSNWQTMRLRYLVNISTEKGRISENKHYVGLENIVSRTGEYTQTEINVDELPNDRFYKGNILFGKLRPYLKKIWQADFDGVASSEFIIFKDSKLVTRYLYWILFSDSFLEDVNSSTYGTKMPRASWEYIKNIIVTVPSKTEQKKISEFLDSETNKLDKIIASAKKSLELLQEIRKSIIFEVVTKGLDNNVEMKDSGVEWIGWIPDSWKISKFKYEVSTPITDGPHETPELYEEGIPFASAEAVKNGIVDLRYIRGYISEKDHKQFSKKIRPQLNDIFIVKSGAGTGRSGIVTTNEVFDIWSPLALIRTKSNNHNQRYFYYFTLSDAYTKQVESGWSYGTQQNIGMNVLENLYVPVPSKDIQNEIVKYLDYKIGKIDTSIRKTQEIIDLTERTKQSLIYEYVTGKKRVQI